MVSVFPLHFQKFSKNGGRRDVRGSVLVHDIANKIEKLLADKVEAVKVRSFQITIDGSVIFMDTVSDLEKWIQYNFLGLKCIW